MKQLISWSFLFILAGSITLVSCKKEKKEEVVEEPEVTPTPSTTYEFKATVDGTPKSYSNFVCMYKNATTSKFIIIQLSVNVSTISPILLRIDNSSAVGVYKIDKTGSSSASADFNPDPTYSFSAQSGTIEITEIKDNKISGKFNFVTNDNGGVHTITEGVFNNVPFGV